LKKAFNIISVLFLTTIILLAPVVHAETGEGSDTAPCSLTVKTEIEGMKISLYTLATEEGGNRTVSEAFAGFSDDLDGIFEEEKRTALSERLKTFVSEQESKAESTMITDKNGEVFFSALKEGIYFILPEKLSKDGYTYSVNPFIVHLPDGDSVTGEIRYDVRAFPKTDKTESVRQETAAYRVITVWEDNQSEEKRPSSITVELWRDGVLYETKVLKPDTNWSYTWSSLPTGYNWTLTETEIEHYRSTVTLQDTTFVITNTVIPSQEETETSGTSTGRIAKTGLLWWPVPVLLAVGLVFLLFGLMIKKRNPHE